MKKDLIDTIMEKEFNELSDAERMELKEFCSTESEYIQMKEVFISVESMPLENPKPRKETKEKLDELFASNYPKAAPIWYSSMGGLIVRKNKPIYRQPLMQIAAVGLLLLLIYPLWNSTEIKDTPNSEIASNEVVEKPVIKQKTPKVAPVAKTMNQTPDNKSEITDTKETMLIAAVEKPVASVDTPGKLDSNHPDGVYIAYSQPASDAPEMLDLLTATF